MIRNYNSNTLKPNGNKTGIKLGRLSNHQVEQLNEKYKLSAYPTANDFDRYALELGLSVSRINKWFQKRRKENRFKKNQSMTTHPLKETQTNYQKPQENNLTRDQLKVLQEYYLKNKTLFFIDYSELSDKTGLSFNDIDNWFDEKENSNEALGTSTICDDEKVDDSNVQNNEETSSSSSCHSF